MKILIASLIFAGILLSGFGFWCGSHSTSEDEAVGSTIPFAGALLCWGIAAVTAFVWWLV